MEKLGKSVDSKYSLKLQFKNSLKFCQSKDMAGKKVVLQEKREERNPLFETKKYLPSTYIPHTN